MRCSRPFPSVGPFTALLIWAEVGDIRRFRTAAVSRPVRISPFPYGSGCPVPPIEAAVESLQKWLSSLGVLVVFSRREFPIYAPPGKANATGERLEAVALKACILSVVLEGEALPLVWLFAPQKEAEVSLGKQLLEAALPLPVAAGAKTLPDAGYVDGA